jgi:DNA-binding NtrC family response regulator
MQSKKPVKTIMFVSGRKPEAIIEQELRRRGLKVEWANSIKGAADLLDSTSERTGLVTDLALADGNWRDLVEHVRAVSSSIPIVVVSPASTAELWWDALDCDVEDILVAPLSASRLCEVLGTHSTDLAVESSPWDPGQGRSNAG